MNAALRPRPWRVRIAVAGAALALPLGTVACGSVTAPRGTVAAPARARAYVDTFDRILIAGFVTHDVADGGRRLDVNHETSRLLRTTLRSKGGLNIIESQPVALPPRPRGEHGDESVFADASFWKEVGEEYGRPLMVTGTVQFERVGPQFEERSAGPRSVMMWRPRYRLALRLVFISGRTGEMLDSVTLRSVAMRARDGRTSALSLYFGLMDAIAPSVLAAFGRFESLIAHH